MPIHSIIVCRCFPLPCSRVMRPLHLTHQTHYVLCAALVHSNRNVSVCVLRISNTNASQIHMHFVGIQTTKHFFLIFPGKFFSVTFFNRKVVEVFGVCLKMARPQQQQQHSLIFSPFLNMPSFLVAVGILCIITSPMGVCAAEYTQASVLVPLNRGADQPQPATDFHVYYEFSDWFITDATNFPMLIAVCGQYPLDACKTKMKVLEEMAPKLNARIVYVEHRFYGKSLPANAFSSVEMLANLRVEEVLEDVRAVVLAATGAQTQKEAMQRAIVVGEQYGGALALWLAMDNKQKPDEKKEKPRFVWAASPSLLALWQDAPFSTKFDRELTELLTKEFGCKREALQGVFKWMDDTVAADAQKGIETVKAAFHYSDGDNNIDGVKADVLEWLRQFAMWPTKPSYDATAKKFVWPMEQFCTDLNAATTDEERAKSFGNSVQKIQSTTLNVKYKEILYGVGNERMARDFQRCTQLGEDHCAAGGENDAFFAQKCQEEKYMENKCQNELLKDLKTQYDPATMYKQNFIADTFGFDFEKVQNALITGAQFDHFFVAARKELGDRSGKSYPDKHFYQFPSVGLMQRAQEVALPNSCDSLAHKQARTQFLDIFLCMLDAKACPSEQEWPVALVEQTRQTDAETHQEQCKQQRWAYPWAEYKKAKPDPKPDPEPATTTTTTTTTTTNVPGPDNGVAPTSGIGVTAIAMVLMLVATRALAY